MIVITDQMKDTMDNDPVQLVLEFSSIFKRIFTDTVDADEQVTGESITFAIIEGDDVCEIIMLKLLLVYIQDVVVGTEDYRYVTDTADLALGNKSKPSVVQSLSLKNEVGIFKVVRNHVLIFFCKSTKCIKSLK